MGFWQHFRGEARTTLWGAGSLGTSDPHSLTPPQENMGAEKGSDTRSMEVMEEALVRWHSGEKTPRS